MTMAGKIQILPHQVAQSIAAGEVIERPASVVKELMENAIDAGSSEIIVELKGGGLQLIRVSDNGEGMDPEDVPIALQRYATSKIQQAEDLYAIETLGFRGEALPSITSVSQMIIKTRVRDSISGTKVVCEGGEIISISEVGCPVGTEVEVRNLFYNIPVKRKFLKSIRTELHYSLNHFLRLSLSHPTISFKLIHDDRMLYEYSRTETTLVRIEAILGKEIYDHLQAFEFEEEGMKISGFATLPSISKGTAGGIYIYVNRRFVKDRLIYRASLEAYRHVIPAGRFPVVILFIAIRPSAVDVNVHPTKAEVKFRDPERVFHAVMGTLSSVLDGRSLSPQPVLEGEKNDLAYSKTAPGPSMLMRSYPVMDGWTRGDEEQRVPTVGEAACPGWKVEGRIPCRILGQIQGTYILCEEEKGLIIIDQHAAHERILFEKYKNEYETKSISSERFLIPLTMELSAEESFALSSHLEAFQGMGFEIDPIGEREFAIRSIPSFLGRENAKERVRQILDELSLGGREGKGTETLQTILVTLACHSAVRGNFTLRREEMEELVEKLHPFNLSTTCPHGRPIFFLFDRDELDKQFKRK